LSLDDEKVNCSCGQEQTAGEDIPISEIDIADNERSEKTKKEIP
jgi:hypothetical protein